VHQTAILDYVRTLHRDDRSGRRWRHYRCSRNCCDYWRWRRYRDYWRRRGRRGRLDANFWRPLLDAVAAVSPLLAVAIAPVLILLPVGLSLAPAIIGLFIPLRVAVPVFAEAISMIVSTSGQGHRNGQNQPDSG
jgi:hypothetical protein